nr:hypothetical protein [Pseudomonas sp. BIGb0427]
MFEAPLPDVLVIGPERNDNRVEPVILYLPGAPGAALKEYPSVKAASDDLKVLLRKPRVPVAVTRLRCSPIAATCIETAGGGAVSPGQ